MALENSHDDDSAFLLLLPLIVGIGLIALGYRAFRYGEEVEEVQGKVKKALGSKRRSAGWMENMMGGDMNVGDLMKTGMDLLDDMSKTSKR